MHGSIKVFQPHPTLPGLDSQPARQIVHQFRQVADHIRSLQAAFTPTVTELHTETGYTAKLGEVVRVNPPAAGLDVMLSPAVEGSEADETTIAVVSVASGGSVRVTVAGGGLVNGAASMTLSAVGIYVFQSLGATYEGWIGPPASSGGGLTPIADDSLLANVSGAPAIPVGVLLSSLAGTGLTWNAALNRFDVSAAGSDPRIFAWWGV